MVATYKVIQDIEAEDKLLGPLSLRQFIYAAIVVVLGFIGFKLAVINFLLALPLIFPMLFFGLLAAPFGVDQSSEVWLLAKIRFFIKPRRRIWDQDGIQELVTITAPKKEERVFTNGLSQTEVKSRLSALASTLDSRGWAVKNVSVNMFANPSYLANSQTGSDRLIDVSSLPHDVPSYEVTPSDDILDEGDNPASRQIDALIKQSQDAHRTNMIQSANPKQGSTQSDYTLLNDQAEAEEVFLERRHREQAQPDNTYSHLKTLHPLSNKSSKAHDDKAQNRGNTTSDKSVNPDILRLAGNDDLNVSTIAREANRKKRSLDDDGEVVVSLR